ncbi:MAG: D-alanine--D-alanine ligase [Clostridia bacterium]|nr:D-alanine--D-alanine ligase [Clostridia bacterium]
MKKVLLIFGGRSSEYKVSLVSAHSVISNIPRDKYDVALLGITEEGRWLYYDGDTDLIPGDSWQGEHCYPAALCPDHGAKRLDIRKNDGSVCSLDIDAVFPVLHGRNGEDGTIQGLFQLAGIPFVGCDCLSSAMCMDKAVANTMLVAFGIKHAEWRSCRRSEYDRDPDGFRTECETALGYPMFVKPANAGSSVGISKIHSADEFRGCVLAAFAEDGKIVVERAITGREVECAVLGDEELFVSAPGEIRACNEFYDYEAKYHSVSELIIPAELPEDIAAEVRHTAEKAFRAMGCRGMTRVDSFITPEGEVIVNELNTIPGFTSISMYSKMLEASGIPYPEIIDRLLHIAMAVK